MDPELDFVHSIGDKGNQNAIPRKAGAAPPQQTETPFDGQNTAFQDESGGLPDAFDRPTGAPSPVQPAPMAEYVEPSDVATYGQDPAPAPVEEEVAAEEPLFSDDLLAIAGLSEEEAIRDFETPDALQAAVRMLDRQTVDRAMRTPIEPAPSVLPDIVVEEEQWEMPEPTEQEGWDPDTKKLIDAVNARNDAMLAKQREQLKAQQAYLQSMIDQQEQAAAAQRLREFDENVNALPDEYRPILGRGTVHDLNPNGIHYTNRIALEETMGALQRGNAMRGLPEIDSEMLMVRALAVAFPDVNRQVVRREVVEEVADRRTMMTPRPTARRPQAQTGEQKAQSFAEEWYRRNQIPNGHDQAEPSF
jgi:hypothetical protein